MVPGSPLPQLQAMLDVEALETQQPAAAGPPPCTPVHTVHRPACSYVRRNAVLAINAIYRLPKGELLLSDAPDLVEKVLQVGLVLSSTLLGVSDMMQGFCAQGLLSDLTWGRWCSRRAQCPVYFGMAASRQP